MNPFSTVANILTPEETQTILAAVPQRLKGIDVATYLDTQSDNDYMVGFTETVFATLEPYLPAHPTAKGLLNACIYAALNLEPHYLSACTIGALKLFCRAYNPAFQRPTYLTAFTLIPETNLLRILNHPIINADPSVQQAAIDALTPTTPRGKLDLLPAAADTAAAVFHLADAGPHSIKTLTALILDAAPIHIGPNEQ